MTNEQHPAAPEVQHGKLPAQNPEVVVSGPLGETTVRVGGEQVYPVPESPQEPAGEPDSTPEPQEPAEGDSES
jgi:hypothetical protein